MPKDAGIEQGDGRLAFFLLQPRMLGMSIGMLRLDATHRSFDAV